jgi:hypothetical protein
MILIHGNKFRVEDWMCVGATLRASVSVSDGSRIKSGEYNRLTGAPPRTSAMEQPSECHTPEHTGDWLRVSLALSGAERIKHAIHSVFDAPPSRQAIDLEAAKFNARLRELKWEPTGSKTLKSLSYCIPLDGEGITWSYQIWFDASTYLLIRTREYWWRQPGECFGEQYTEYCEYDVNCDISSDRFDIPE